MFMFLSFATENEKSKFDYIYKKYKRLLLSKAYNILNDYSLAEDAASEAFIRIYKNLNKIENLDSAKTVSFIVTIVKNVSITLLNKKRREDSVDMETIDIEDDFDLEDYIVLKGETESLIKLIDKLSEELRAPFLLKYAHNMSHKEISTILNITENNVTVRIHRARKKLAGYISERGVCR